jgi:hypothetical protein
MTGLPIAEQHSQQSNALDWLAPAIALLSVFILTSHTPVDPDMWWHLRAGEAMWQHGQIITRDIFSYTRAGAPWTNVFWLADLFFYGIYQLAGLFGLTVFASLMATATFGIVYRRMPGHPVVRAVFIVLGALAAAPSWTPRPQLFSFFLLAILDYWLHTRDLRFRNFALPLALFALWPNLHGAVIWGFLLLVAHLAGNGFSLLIHPGQAVAAKDKLFRQSIFTISAAFIILLNPSGFRVWQLPFKQIDVSLVSIQEWRSPDFHSIGFQPILWLLLAFIMGLARTRKRIAFSDLFAAAGFTYLTFVAQRNMGPYAIVVAPLAAQVWSDSKGYWATSRLWLALGRRFKSTNEVLPRRVARPINMIFVSLIAATALYRVTYDSLPETINKKLPAKAIQWVHTNQPSGPLFNSYNWGGYILWSLKNYPVFIDGRADLYGNDVIEEWWQIASGSDRGLSALKAHGINLVILEPEYTLTKLLPKIGWQIVYSDGFLVVLERLK